LLKKEIGKRTYSSNAAEPVQNTAGFVETDFLICTSIVTSFSLLYPSSASGARAAIAAPNRLLFANQSDFGAKQGFYLDLENDSSGDQPCKLATLRLIFAVGDGKS